MNHKPIKIPDSELEFNAVRAQGAGGQNVNKVSSAIHLRFDINGSSLPDDVKVRLLGLHDHRVTDEGIIVIKAQSHRSQEKNRADAVMRLHEMIENASILPRIRKPTSPTRSSQKKRLEFKVRRAGIKSLRGKVIG